MFQFQQTGMYENIQSRIHKTVNISRRGYSRKKDHGNIKRFTVLSSSLSHQKDIVLSLLHIKHSNSYSLFNFKRERKPYICILQILHLYIIYFLIVLIQHLYKISFFNFQIVYDLFDTIHSWMYFQLFQLTCHIVPR